MIVKSSINLNKKRGGKLESKKSEQSEAKRKKEKKSRAQRIWSALGSSRWAKLTAVNFQQGLVARRNERNPESYSNDVLIKGHQSRQTTQTKALISKSTETHKQ